MDKEELHAWYQKIGSKGGKSTKKRLGSQHYIQIGRLGGRRTGELIHAGQKQEDREEAITSVEEENQSSEVEKEWDEN